MNKQKESVLSRREKEGKEVINACIFKFLRDVSRILERLFPFLMTLEQIHYNVKSI